MRAAILLATLLVSSPALGQGPLVALAGAGHARRTHGRIVDCADHGAWTEPEAWTTSSADGIVVAIAPGGRAALARVRARPHLRTDESFAEQVAAAVLRLTGAAPSLAAVVAVDHGRWRRERTVEGTLELGGQRLHVWAHARRTGALWVASYDDADGTARAVIDAAVASWASLTSHACACGTDCGD